MAFIVSFSIVILGIALLTFNFDSANGICCSHYTIEGKGRVCGDCKSAGLFDCCGTSDGACNVFCCNCKGDTCSGGSCDLDGRGGKAPPMPTSTPPPTGTPTNKTQAMSCPIGRMDKNGDKKASKEEVMAYINERKTVKKEGNGKLLGILQLGPKAPEFNFDSYDHNKDGFLTLEEVDSAPK